MPTYGVQRRKHDSLWKDVNYVRCYEFAREGCALTDMARLLGISESRFRTWVKRDKALATSIEEGRSKATTARRSDGQTFLEYVYQRLPPELRELWEELEAVEKEPHPEKRVEALLRDKGERTRQMLWVHALVACNFDQSKACRKVMVPKSALDRWKTEPEFARLIDEIHWHRKNAIDGAVFDLVAARDPKVVVFAAQTLAKDRGYTKEVEVRHTGGVMHGIVNMDDLPVEMRKQMLEIARKKKEQAAVVDVTPGRVEE